RDVTELMETQRALIESEERLRAVLETAQDGIVVADLDGTITLVNRACCGLLGCVPGDLVGRSGFDLLGTDGASVRPAGPAPPEAESAPQRTTRYIRRRDGG